MYGSVSSPVGQTKAFDAHLTPNAFYQSSLSDESRRALGPSCTLGLSIVLYRSLRGGNTYIHRSVSSVPRGARQSDVGILGGS
jgi:hypothetical protein